MTGRTKLPPKCDHCGAREPLDRGMCIDYNACINRKPLAGTRLEAPKEETDANS